MVARFSLILFSLAALFAAAGAFASAAPLRYQKMQSDKYSQNEDLSSFKKMGSYKHMPPVPDELLKNCFESKKIKYVLLEKFRQGCDGLPILWSIIYFDEKYKLDKEDLHKAQKELNDKSFLLMFPITEREFADFSRLISHAATGEIMCRFSRYSEYFVIPEPSMIATYFDGEKQHTVYFSAPECSVLDKIKEGAKNKKAEFDAAEYLMRAWRYGNLNGFIDHELISGEINWLLKDKAILKRLDDGIKEALGGGASETARKEKN